MQIILQSLLLQIYGILNKTLWTDIHIFLSFNLYVPFPMIPQKSKAKNKSLYMKYILLFNFF